MAGNPSVPEPEIRGLVRRVVEGVLDGRPGATPAAGSPPVETTSGDTGARPESPDGQSVAIGADHGGFVLKEQLVAKLEVAGHTVKDCGTNGPDSVDYPDFAHAVAKLVADGTCRWGIVVDGAGIGSAMVANKVPGVRAALCYDLSSARNSREHNHANVLTLGASLIGPGLAWQIVQEWLATPWGPDRHARRVAMIDDIERSYTGPGR